jgi:hypothetical protein
VARSWISRQRSLVRAYTVVVGELNDIGIYPNGAEIKEWIRQEIKDEKVEVTEEQRQMLLSALLAENAISQEDINRFASRHLCRTNTSNTTSK